MLHCTMKPLFRPWRLGLEDLLGDLWHARRTGDLGRLALLSCFEVRRWARLSGEHELDQHASELVTGFPYAGRDNFLDQVDALIAHLEQVLARDDEAEAADPAQPGWQAGSGVGPAIGPAATGARSA
jgi:hypothetical protein